MNGGEWCDIGAQTKKLWRWELMRSGTGLQDDARDARGARGTVGNASLVGFTGNCVESWPDYPRSAPLNACSRESQLSGNSWRNLPRRVRLLLLL